MDLKPTHFYNQCRTSISFSVVHWKSSQGNCVTNNRQRLAIYNRPIVAWPEETNLAHKKAYARINAMIGFTALQLSYGKVALNAFSTAMGSPTFSWTNNMDNQNLTDPAPRRISSTRGKSHSVVTWLMSHQAHMTEMWDDAFRWDKKFG